MRNPAAGIASTKTTRYETLVARNIAVTITR
jgi:hypothetical protein